MKTYIALFRGINIGGKHILPMNELVEILISVGCQNVKTYIQSGNAVFKSKKMKANSLAGMISSKVLKTYGFEPTVLLLEISEFQEAIENNPFDTQNGKALHFFFLDSLPDHPDLEKLRTIKSNSEEFRLYKQVFYLYAPDGVGRSKLAAKVEQCMGIPVTARNWNTVSKLLSMAKKQSTAG